MGWLAKIKEFFDRAAAALRELPAVLRDRPKLAVMGLGALILVFAAVLLAALVSLGTEKPPPGAEISGALSPRAIPTEELFLPSEPDFLPPVILEREQRDLWTVEDALPYWTDPLKGEDIPYVNRMRGMVDTIMERIP
jgi:hypothetical protein